jgi:hypothetical protein
VAGGDGIGAAADAPRRGPPPLRPFDLVLHHDGRWTHEGVPLRNRRLRAAFDVGVRFLPEEGERGKYVVVLGHFRGEIIVEEAAFFVRDFDPDSGEIALSDRSRALLDVSSLSVSERDGALLCRVKHELAPAGLLARFRHAAQAELLNAVDDSGTRARLRIAGELQDLPDL